MILQDLRLHNFCLYKGEHVFDLRVSKRSGRACPIVLFGGMNGAGKTTILDAVQLALYGSRARCSNRIGKGYEDYLRECIHRGVAEHEGASVSITFRYVSEGQEHSYEVWRGWSENGNRVRERVRVAKDDEVDQYLSEQWNEIVEELIPLGISQLFFFDAEKVRFLADDATDTQSLGSAIKSMLGLDLAERLIADASVLERKLSDRVLSAQPGGHVKALMVELTAIQAELTAKKGERASLENPLSRAKQKQLQAEQEFSQAGGAHWQNKREYEQRLGALKERKQELDIELRDHCSADLPLLLIPELLDRVESQDSSEKLGAEQRIFRELLASRDAEVLKALNRRGVERDLIGIVRKIQDEDREARKRLETEERRLDLSARARSLLFNLRSSGLAERKKRVSTLLKEVLAVSKQCEATERSLEAAPDDAQVAVLVEGLKQRTAEFATLDDRARRMDQEIEELQRKRSVVEDQLMGYRRSAVESEISQEETARVAKLAQKTQSTMREFLRRSTAQKIDRLSSLITESFRFLLRKQTLVHDVQIDPTSFRIVLHGAHGNEIPKSRLSEGEKQVFAIAVLWGLARAAPRQLPAIIDTPMARLDSEHRQHLVERYFPNASHQVIILSTDTEVEKGFFEHLSPNVSRSYHLRYDDGTRCTVPEEGYFFAEDKEPTRIKVTS